MKKGAPFEQAWLHRVLALRELPSEVIIPPRLELSQLAIDQVVRLAATPRKPTEALSALIAGKHGHRR